MFIERQCHPNIEFDPSAGQQKPTLSFFFSTIAEPLKSTLPLLSAYNLQSTKLLSNLLPHQFMAFPRHQ